MAVDRLSPRGNRRFLLGVVAVVALIALVTSWVRGADVRRVNDACDTWLEHRQSLRAAVAETDEATERAVHARDSRVTAQFNDIDTVRQWLTRWVATSPGVRESLDDDEDASALERGAVWSLGSVEDGVVELHRLIEEEEEPHELASWLPEVEARFRSVDDVCLSAARS